MTGVSWAQCGEILAEMSNEERLAVKRVAGGKAGSIVAPVLEKLRLLSLVQLNGQMWVLTDD